MKKVLIVDDNPQNLYMLEIMLLSNNYEIRKAVNGKEALEQARAERPDLVITDILMPVMDGFSLCRELKKDTDLKNIPLIFYTATYTDPRDEEFAMSLGADRFLVKPMDPSEMLTAIREVLQTSERILRPIPPEQPENETYYKSYSETLVRKLEEKMLQLEQVNKRQTALYQASCEMVRQHAPREMIQMVLRTIVETAGYQKANYFEYDLMENRLRLTSSSGFAQEPEIIYGGQLEFKLGEELGLVGTVAQTLQVINIPDTKSDPRWIVLDESINSALFVPVVYEKHLIGVMALYSHEKDAFGLDDAQNITALTNSLAVAIENNEKESQLEKQLRKVSALHTIDMTINSNLDLRSALKAILKISVEQLSADAADVVLFNPYSLTFDFAAGYGLRPTWSTRRKKENG
jgi:CheY-like chemotaxis protein